jgi:hypothetical protein
MTWSSRWQWQHKPDLDILVSNVTTSSEEIVSEGIGPLSLALATWAKECLTLALRTVELRG